MIDGADPATVAAAVRDRDPLPGTAGFAGRLPDGRLVRDVLGRRPLFVDATDGSWSHRPDDLDDPASFPAGHVGRATDHDRAWRLPDPEPADDPNRTIVAVREAVEFALADAPTDGLAVAFSGGVDSALVAAGLDPDGDGDLPLYVVGFPESHDLEAARDSARRMGRDLRVVELAVADVEDAVPAVARATGRTNAMDVAIALPLYLVARRAAADGHDRLAVGQGADELFGGYAKVAKAQSDPRVEADSVRGARREMLATLPDQLERDVLALRAAGVEPVAPLLHDRVVEAALRLPGDLLVDDRGERKVALRRAAREFLPDPVAFRAKKAVQYGSLVSRELDRLARQAGFKRRMDDHVTRYVESRL